MRRFFCLLLLICLPLHSFALQGGLPLSAQIVHELEHDQGIQHHHHEDDGSIHYDQSDESAQHAQDHPASPHSAWSPAPHVFTPAAARLSARVALEPSRFVPEPFHDGPHRPPAPSLG